MPSSPSCYHSLPSYSSTAKVILPAIRHNFQISAHIVPFIHLQVLTIVSSEPGIIKGTFLSEDLMKREALGSSPNQSRPFSASTDAEGQHALVVLGEDVEPLGGEAACPECSVQVALGCPGTEYPGSRDLAASCVGKMLTVRLKTKYGLPTQEDWARSHFGPIVIGESFSQISLYLPGNRVLAPGLPEFAWSGSRESWQFGLGPSSSLHLPLVLALHPNNQWMMLWLETDRPGEQVLSPGACSHL